FVIDVMGIALEGLEVVVNGRVIVLQVNGMARGLVILLTLRATRCEHAGKDKNSYLGPTDHEVSGTSSGGNPRLVVLRESSIGVLSAASRGCVIGAVKRSHKPVAQPFFEGLTGSREEKERARAS